MKTSSRSVFLSVTTLALVAVGFLVADVRADHHGDHGSAAATAGGDAGPGEGAYLPPFTVTKVAGAEDDGVEAGEKLCYRCKNGSRPQVVVFTKSSDEKVVELVKKLDGFARDHESEQVRVFVNVLNADESAAKADAEKMASATDAKSIPFVVPSDNQSGPKSYNVGEDTAVLITMAVDSEIVGNVAVKDASELDVQMVMDQAAKMLN